MAHAAAFADDVVEPVHLEGLRHAVPYLAPPPRKGAGEAREATPGTPASGGARAGASGIPRLREEEVAAFCAVVLAHAGGSFAGHLEHALAGAAAPLDRVAAYVLGPRPTQYCVRLFAFPANGALRDALRRRLQLLPDVELRLARLPEGLQKLLQEPGPA